MNPSEALSWVESELTRIAKENPAGDYYVGSVGEEIRDVLKKIMGDRYPSDELDEKPYVRGPRPDPEKDPFGAMIWDQEISIHEMMLSKHFGSPWISLLKSEKWPDGRGDALGLLISETEGAVAQ